MRNLALSPPASPSASQRPDLLNHGEQNGGCQPEQKHPVQRLKSTHQLPLLFQKKVRVAVACHCAERIEHRRLVVWQSAEKPVGGGPVGRLDAVQLGSQQGSDAYHHHESWHEEAMLHSATQNVDDPLINERETDDVDDYV